MLGEHKPSEVTIDFHYRNDVGTAMAIMGIAQSLEKEHPEK